MHTVIFININSILRVTAVADIVSCLFQLHSEKHSNINSKRLSTQPHLLSVDNMLACITVGQRQITEAEALYVLASRYLELNR